METTKRQRIIEQLRRALIQAENPKSDHVEISILDFDDYLITLDDEK